MVKFLKPTLVLVVLLSACSKDIHNPAAVRQGVIDYLSTRKNLDLDLTAMDVDVTGVSFREDEADATVSFRVKGSPSGGMQMRYTLERSGSQWKVKSTAEGGSPHSAGAAPGADPHGGMDMGGAPGQALPPGHPSVDSPSNTPPAGQPK